MKMSYFSSFFLLLVFSSFSLAQTGSNPPLQSISPSNEPVTVGNAGDDPADIGRYLLASGAGNAQLSPDGSKLAFSYSVTGVPQLWIIPTQTGQMRQLTFGNGISFFRWSPDSNSLLYGADDNGNEQEAYYMIAADGSRSHEVLAPVVGGFRSFGDFAPDGKAIFFASTERNGLDFDIYQANLETGNSEILYQGRYGFFAHALSPDGKQLIVSETVGEDSDNLYLVDTATGSLSTLSKPDDRASHRSGGVAWLPDSSGFYLATSMDREFTELARFDMGSRRFTAIAAAEHDIQNVNLCGEGGQYLAWTVNDDGFYRVNVRSLSTGSDLITPSLPEGVHSLSCGDRSSKLAIRTTGWRTPGDVHIWDLASGEVSQRFESNMAGLDGDRLVRPQSIRMPARDGVELQGLLYMPTADSRIGQGVPPVVFEVHGGPTAQSLASFDALAQYHVDRGVAVFKPNVRGSTGFGRTYLTLDDRVRRLDSVRDLVDMLDFFKRDGRVDAERAAVAGGSYGGYMVNAVLATFPGTFKAGVSRYSVADWVTALEVASPQLKASDIIEYGDIQLPEWRSFYEINSPIRQADRINVPVLFSHGEMDPRIDIVETETMVRALRANNVEAQFIRIPDEGHGWRKLSNRLFYYRREAEFLEAQLLRE